jgi:hypothetical protein
VEHGYLADCSVTPHVSWQRTLGDPNGSGGPDYRHFPSHPYFLDLERIDCPGNSQLLEVPPTIIKSKLADIAPLVYELRGVRRFAEQYSPPISWIFPNGSNLDRMLRCVRTALAQGREHIEFVIHSSELMPGGSPRFVTKESIEGLYRDLRVLFSEISKTFAGLTLSEFRSQFSSNRDAMKCAA